MLSRNVLIRELFDVERGKSRYTRSYGDAHPGPVPLYSASLAGPMTYIDTADYAGPLLTFTTNGYAGSVQIIEGDFAINGDRAVLLPKPGVTLPDLRYLARLIEQELRPLAIGRIADKGRNEYTKLSPRAASDVEIPLLTDKDGDEDYLAMEAFGDTIERAAKLQKNLDARAAQIKGSNLIIELEGETTDVSLGDAELFSRTIGKRVLRDELVKDGEIPVYSANAREPMGFVNNLPNGLSFELPSLIWGIDGVFDWNLIPADQPFVPTDHCGRLQVLHEGLDPEYLLFTLRATRDEHGFNRVFRANLLNIQELSVPVPVTSTGAFDLEQQRAIALRYRRQHRIARELLVKIEQLTEVVVTPSV